MKNLKVHPDHVNLLHKIRASKTLEKLSLLKQVVIKFHRSHPEDKGELLKAYAFKDQELGYYDYEEDSIESLQHQRAMGAQN